MNLGKKIGPLPLWAWIGVGIAGIIAGRYLQSRIGAGQSAASAGAAAPDLGTGAAGVGSSYPDFGGAVSSGAAGDGGIAPAPSGIDPSQYVQDVIAAFGQGQASQGSFLSGFQTAEGFFGSPGGGYTPPAPVATGGGPTGIANPPTAPIPSSTTTSLGKAAAPFGGILSTRTTKAGVKITTYRSGRVVEQAPGKTAYIAKKGR